MSTVDDNVSTIANGIYLGENFQKIVSQFPEEILGKKVYNAFGTNFPLLFKILDAKEDLSIQVHPNDELAQERHQSFGKTEMWYVIKADEHSKLIVGFKEDISKQQYLQAVENEKLLDFLQEIPVKQGDVFYLETGIVHAIGAGTVLAEIQQTSDITYRIFDYNRKDSSGNVRELHTELALDAIKFEKSNSQINYSSKINEVNNIVDSSYFTTNLIPLNGAIELVNNGDSFKVMMCVDGSFQIDYDGQIFEILKGQTVLFPAVIDQYKLLGNATILEIYISK